MELEAARNKPMDDSLSDIALTASKLLEKAYTGLYQRIQDNPGKDDAWKTSLLDLLEKVSQIALNMYNT